MDYVYSGTERVGKANFILRQCSSHEATMISTAAYVLESEERFGATASALFIVEGEENGVLARSALDGKRRVLMAGDVQKKSFKKSKRW